tara:strand:+ start:3319 stop:4167 length:849 start_codon:yes stop_codon:yes gene_type:complete
MKSDNISQGDIVAENETLALYPQLWKGLEFAWYPPLAPGGTIIRDFGPHKRHAYFINGLAVGNWVRDEPYGACLDLSAGKAVGDGSLVDCAQWGAPGAAYDDVQSGQYVLNFKFCTVVGLQKPNDVTGNDNSIYGRVHDVDGGGDGGFNLNGNNNTAEGNRHGMFFRMNSNYTSSGGNATGSTSGKWRSVGGRWSSDHKPEFWTNGVLREKRSSAATASPGNNGNNSVHGFGAFRGATGSRGCDGLLGPVLVWSRALDDDDFVRVQNDIWAPLRHREYHQEI